MFNLSKHELAVLRKLSTPTKIQDFLNELPINNEPKGDTCMSPRRVLREKTAHCIEGAMLAAVALRLHGHAPLLMDLKANAKDLDHVVALFRYHGAWGAISKTNHVVLRYREPVYRTLRELALSYFHEYFTNDGKKSLISFSRPLDLSRFNSRGWMTDERDVFYIPAYLDGIQHFAITTPAVRRMFRLADDIEIGAGKLVEWDKRGKRLFKAKGLSKASKKR